MAKLPHRPSTPSVQFVTFVFILVFCVMTLLFVPVERELVIYLIMIAAAMLSGYFDILQKIVRKNKKIKVIC